MKINATRSGKTSDQNSKTGSLKSQTSFDLEAHIPYLLVRSANLIGQITHQRYQDALPSDQTLLLREFRTLLIVASRGVVAPAAVAAATGMDRATITRAVAALRRKNLVSELQNTEDKRAKFIKLTANGVDLSNRIFPEMQVYAQKIESTFTEAEIKQFTSMLDRLALIFQTDPT